MNNLLLQASQPQGSSSISILMLVGMVVVFYFFMMRPQMKKQKELRNFRSQLKKGDKIVTNGGIYGEVHGINEEKGTATVTVANGVDIVFTLSSLNPLSQTPDNNRR
ncbi:MAG: preprotein translocase subunit YajC [Bacteroidales bacterium]